MGPAQPWQYKTGKLVCSDDASHVRTQCSAASAPGIAAESRPWCKGTQEKRAPRSTLGTPCKTDTPKQSYRWLLTDTCALLQIGSKMEEEKQQQTSQAKVSWLGAPGSGLTYSTLTITDTQQTLLSSTEGEEEQHKHWAALAEAIKQFKCVDTIPCIIAVLVPASSKQQRANENKIT